jgi:hypothetical protein
MNLGRTLSAKGCVWALIVLTICQPVVHSSCFCACAEATEVSKLQATDATKIGKCSSRCCAKKAHKKHRDHEKLSLAQKASKEQNAPRPIGPCECPRDCPCQVQHQVAPASLAKTESPLGDSAKELVACDECHEYRAQRLYTIALSKEIAIGSRATAAATCAELCRFLS